MCIGTHFSGGPGQFDAWPVTMAGNETQCLQCGHDRTYYFPDDVQAQGQLFFGAMERLPPQCMFLIPQQVTPEERDTMEKAGLSANCAKRRGRGNRKNRRDRDRSNYHWQDYSRVRPPWRDYGHHAEETTNTGGASGSGRSTAPMEVDAGDSGSQPVRAWSKSGRYERGEIIDVRERDVQPPPRARPWPQPGGGEQRGRQGYDERHSQQRAANADHRPAAGRGSSDEYGRKRNRRNYRHCQGRSGTLRMFTFCKLALLGIGRASEADPSPYAHIGFTTAVLGLFGLSGVAVVSRLGLAFERAVSGAENRGATISDATMKGSLEFIDGVWSGAATVGDVTIGAICDLAFVARLCGILIVISIGISTIQMVTAIGRSVNHNVDEVCRGIVSIFRREKVRESVPDSLAEETLEALRLDDVQPEESFLSPTKEEEVPFLCIKDESSRTRSEIDRLVEISKPARRAACEALIGPENCDWNSPSPKRSYADPQRNVEAFIATRADEAAGRRKASKESIGSNDSRGSSDAAAAHPLLRVDLVDISKICTSYTEAERRIEMGGKDLVVDKRDEPGFNELAYQVRMGGHGHQTCLAYVNREVAEKGFLFLQKDFAKKKCRCTCQGYRQAVGLNRICVHLAMIFKLRCRAKEDRFVYRPRGRGCEGRGGCQFTHTTVRGAAAQLRPSLAITDRVRDRSPSRSPSRSPERRVSFDRGSSAGDSVPVLKTLDLCGCGERWCKICYVCFYRIDRATQWASYDNGDGATPPASPLPQDRMTKQHRQFFGDYDPDRAENAPEVGWFGEVRAVCTGKECHRLASGLVAKADPGTDIILIAFTFDLPSLRESFIEARGRGCKVKVAFDKKTMRSEYRRAQNATVEALLQAGCEVILMCGNSLQAEYEEAGRQGSGGIGICHAKFLRVGNFAIVGSANWTVSTRANLELGVLCELNHEGMQQLSSIEESYFDRESSVCADVSMLRTFAADTANRREAREESRGRSLSLPRLPPKSYDGFGHYGSASTRARSRSQSVRRERY